MAFHLSKSLAQKVISSPLIRSTLSTSIARVTPVAANVAFPQNSFDTNVRRALSSSEKVPPEDYYDGHLVAEHLEFVDDMIAKTFEIENAMQDLRETHTQKRKAYEESASLEEMEQLFLKAEDQKLEISTHLESLRALLVARRNASHEPFAVDGPDGTSDAMDSSKMQDMAAINKDMGHLENTARINRQHATEKLVSQERARDPEHDW